MVAVVVAVVVAVAVAAQVLSGGDWFNLGGFLFAGIIIVINFIGFYIIAG